ncbi:cupin domain-containing protein [Gryllotalpicola ginsengisoli]|uniref:cupin domain-containing protein n=1 Tax=Gryllotalpicola ginsengisoli TaxID=444608 RepID=UPI0003B71989|nr:cupin domain-containing protein [Gryllotalpicola ginsengisoli]
MTMTDAAAAALSHGLPGAVAVSRLRVYDWPAADGLVGGSPHLHTTSAEGYVVIGGSGAVQTLSSQGLAETPLKPGTVLWFTPGTVHRLVNRSGDLEIVTLMQNAGLPEAGDAVLTFPDEVLRDPARYREAATLPAGADQAQLEQAARARRDLALEGWAALRERAERDLHGALAGLYAAAAAIVAPKVAGWRELWRQGPLAQVEATRLQLDRLEGGDGATLWGSGVAVRQPEPGPERWGMCGRLTVWNAGPAH